MWQYFLQEKYYFASLRDGFFLGTDSVIKSDVSLSTIKQMLSIDQVQEVGDEQDLERRVRRASRVGRLLRAARDLGHGRQEDHGLA